MEVQAGLDERLKIAENSQITQAGSLGCILPIILPAEAAQPMELIVLGKMGNLKVNVYVYRK